MSVVAYTVGLRDGYDAALLKGPISKAPTGVVFRYFAEAKACLGERQILPPAWFPGDAKPGAVYEVELERPLDDVSEPWPEAAIGARMLKVPAPIRRRVDAEPTP